MTYHLVGVKKCGVSINNKLLNDELCRNKRMPKIGETIGVRKGEISKYN